MDKSIVCGFLAHPVECASDVPLTDTVSMHVYCTNGQSRRQLVDKLAVISNTWYLQRGAWHS